MTRDAGQSADSVVARNHLREVGEGAAAHCEHGRSLVLMLRSVAAGRGGGAIKDEQALRDAADRYGVEQAGRPTDQVALELADVLLAEFTSQESPLRTLRLAPLKRQGLWKSAGLEPLGIDRMLVECMHRAGMSVGNDYRDLLMRAFRVSLADGWGGSRVAAIVSDILFGTPSPVRAESNLDVLGEQTVNLIVPGHEPAPSEMLAIAGGDPAKAAIPPHRHPLIAGFSVRAIRRMLGGTFRASFRPLNDAIVQGRITGLVGLVGCENPRGSLDDYVNTLVRELIGHNVLVVGTGSAALASARAGLLTPEAAMELAGPGLREVCEAVGMPPVLHMGGCVDHSRILEAITEAVSEGGVGDDLAAAPAVAVAPEGVSRKTVSIGCCFVASGLDVILGRPFHIAGSQNVTRFFNEDVRERFGASFHVRPDPRQAAELVVEILGARRRKLGIDREQERKLYDMKDRRSLSV